MTVRASSPTFYPSCSSAFGRRTLGSHARTAVSAWVLRSCATWSSSTAGVSTRRARAPARGRCFPVELPVAGIPSYEPPVARGRAPRTESPFEHTLDLAGVRILVVDDQSDARDIIGTILEQYGAEVRVAESTATALTALEKWPFDVLVSDIGMPVDDGYVLIEKLRKKLDHPEVARIPAVALTAYARSEDEQKALASGYDAHVAKPIEPGRLASAVVARYPANGITRLNERGSLPVRPCRARDSDADRSRRALRNQAAPVSPTSERRTSSRPRTSAPEASRDPREKHGGRGGLAASSRIGDLGRKATGERSAA